MKQSDITSALLINHYHKYPQLKIQDIFKFIYQSSFGCEHLISSEDTAYERIRQEYNESPCCSDSLIDSLDGEYSRVSLSYLRHGLSAEMLAKLFFKSAKKEPDGNLKLENKIAAVKELVIKNELPFSLTEFEEALNDWKSSGYSPPRHSDIFRSCYNPSYRVISDIYVNFLPIIAKIDEMMLNTEKLTVTIDGGCASGKTTLSKILEDLYDCNVIHMDDFFLRPEQRTKERYEEVGGNIDRERFSDEILIPLSKGDTIYYRKFNCSTMKIQPAVKTAPKKLTVIEGVYSMHTDFSDYYNLSVFLDISPSLQAERIKKRNSPEFAERFFNEWIPLENRYFTEMKVKDRCNIRIII